MADSGISLRSLQVQHPEAIALNTAYQTLGLPPTVRVSETAGLSVQLQTPKGLVDIQS